MKRLLPKLLLVVAIHPTAMLSMTAQARAQTPDVRVVVDPTVELMGVVQLLAGYMLASRHESSYRADALSYFEPYEDHRAVRLFRKMSEEGFAFDVVPKALLSLSPPPDVRLVRPLHPDVLAAGLDEDDVGDLARALSDFARTSDFDAFQQAHRSDIDAMLERTRPEILEATRALAEYSGLPIQGGVVVLGPLLHDGGFAASVEGGERRGAYAFLGPGGVEDGLPTFGPEDRIAGLVSHEFAHLFVNPLTEEHAVRVAALAGLYDPIADAMRRNAYPRWEIALNEHVIRAITARLEGRRGGPQAEEASLASDEERGFAHVRALAKRLEEYEADRERYPTLRDFYPRLLDALSER